MREDWIEIISNDLTIDAKNAIVDGPFGTQLKVHEFKSEGIPVIEMDNIKGDSFKNEFRRFVNEEKYEQIKRSTVIPGDLLISKTGSLGYVAFAPNIFDKAVITSRLAKMSLKWEYLNPKYFKYWLIHLRETGYWEKVAKGTTMKILGIPQLNNIPIPLPPLPIQRAIVLKIENLFASLDKGIAELKTAQEQLKVYRQAVLKKAFEGEFTKEWRAKQTNLQTVEELKEIIDLSREKFYNQQIIEWEQAVLNWERNEKKGKKPGKPSKLLIPEKPNAEHDNRKWAIPERWIWTQVGIICFVTKLAGFEYTDYVKYDDEGDLTVLKAENAGANGFKKTDFSKIKSETVQMLKRSFLYGGELLVVFVGAGTGNVAVVPKDRKYFLGPNIGMARPYFEINSRFLEFQLQSSVGKHMMMATVKAVAQPSLSMATIRQTPIAFPSVAEQHAIVREIESRLSVCDKVEQSIAEALEKAEALRQSILKKAFEGRLLSETEVTACKQEADYEPASVLLERIKKEKKNGK